MAVRMRPTQILLSEDEYHRLEQQATRRGCSVGQLVREAVRRIYLQPTQQEREEAARRLTAMRVPVADWPQMEEEIIEGAADERSPAVLLP